MTSNAVIRTLAKVRPMADVHPSKWTHHNGTPLTSEELHLVLESGMEDFRAVSRYMHRRVAVNQRLLEIATEVSEIAGRTLEGGDTFEEAMELVDGMEPADYARLSTLGIEQQRLQEMADGLDEVLADPRPTPECPSWCNHHRKDCEGCHYGKIVVNDIEIEVYDEPGFDAPRVDVGGYNWVNGPELTDLAEALHIAERLLSGPEQVSA